MAKARKQGSCESVNRLPVLNGSGTGVSARRVSRMSRWRAAVLVSVHLLIIAHVLHWWYAGRTVSPIEPSESMYTLQRGEINAGFLFFAAALLATLLLGRFVCGWACHVVALQDLCAHVMKKVGVRPRAFRARLLGYVPLGAALYMFVWPTVYRLMWGEAQAFPGFSWHLTTTDFWATFPGVAVAIPFLAICGFGTVYFLGFKGFCTYACPYGGFFGVADRFAPGSIRVTDDCNACGHCTVSCTSNVDVRSEVRKYGMVVDPGCMKCLDCVSVCPNDALYFGFGKPSVAARASAGQPVKVRYDLTWTEELAALAAFMITLLSVRGVYDVVPFLMALGVAAIMSLVTIKAIRLLGRSYVSIQRIHLKSDGRLRLAGWVFVAASLVACGVILHSGFIQYHRSVGERYFEHTAAPEEQVLTQVGLDALPPELIEAASRSRSHLEAAVRFGLLDTGSVRLKLAWLALLQGDQEAAIAHLERAAAKLRDRTQADYYLGSIRSTKGDFAEAVDCYRRALSGQPDHVEARFKLGNALAATGRLSAAKEEWRAVLERAPGHAVARRNLAGALRAEGKLDDAIHEYQMTLQYAPRDAEAHFQLGVTYAGLGRAAEADRHFRQAVALDPRYESYLRRDP